MMMIRVGISAVLAILFHLLTGGNASAQQYIQYVGQQETGCSEGKEIKDYRDFTAPAGKFFSNYRFTPEGPIINHAGSAGQVGCTILSTESPHGYPTVVHLLAHADCGHGGGPTIQAYCRFSSDLGDQ